MENIEFSTKNMKRCTELGNVKGPTDPRPNFNLETAKFQRVPDHYTPTPGTFIPIGRGQMFHWNRPFFNLVATKFLFGNGQISKSSRPNIKDTISKTMKHTIKDTLKTSEVS